jgi:LysR family transcriptional activator of dmlA
MLDDLNELRTFQRILACGSLSAAARDLGVGLAVVSKRLASLEQRAGNRLINRTTRRLSPTNEGLALAPHVDRMLEELAAAEARLASGWEEPHGLLRVSAPISFGRIHLIPLAAALIERYPRLDIELKLEDRVVDLTDEQIDIAVRIGQPRDSSAIMRKLADNRRILVAAPAYLDLSLSANSAITFVCATTITQCRGDSKDRTPPSSISSHVAVCGPTAETR